MLLPSVERFVLPSLFKMKTKLFQIWITLIALCGVFDCHAQTIIGRPMLPINVVAAPTASLFLWYKANAQSLAHSTGPAVPYVDSQTGLNLLTPQNVSNTNPVYKTNIINSLSALVWDAKIDVNLGQNAITTNVFGSKTIDGITIAMVGYFTANAGFGYNNMVQLQDTSENFTLVLFDDGVRVRGRGWFSGANGIATVTNAAANVWHVITMQWSGSDGITSIKNNTDTITGSAGATGNRTVFYSHLNSYPTNQIAEVLVYTNKISSGDLTQLRTYLLNKYAISGTP